jgi:Na+-driven multidrug efflux pump
LNGAHVVKPQVVMALLTACAALSLKIMLVKSMGVSGAVWATTLAYLLLTAIPTFFLLPRIVKGLRARGPAP